jgi:hypothetical protein
VIALLTGAALVGIPLVWAVVEMRARHRAERRADGLQAKLLSAETDNARLEALGGAKHSDELINKYFAQALDSLPVSMAMAIRGALRAEREHRLHKDGDATNPGRKPLPLPPPPEDTGGFITGPLP